MDQYMNRIKDKMSVGLRRNQRKQRKKNSNIDVLLFKNLIDKDFYGIQYLCRKRAFSHCVFEYCKKNGYDIQDITWYWNPFGNYWYQVQKIKYDH